MKKTQKTVNQIQKTLFDQVEKVLPRNVVIVHELAEILSLSTDAVYRRLRGEKKLNIDEICSLCEHFNISMDSLLNTKHNNISFETIPLKTGDLDNFLGHLDALGKIFEKYSPAKNTKALYLATEIPFVHLAAYEELATFKIYTWANSTNIYGGNYPSFCAMIKGDNLFSTYRQISTSYKQIPSMEIWNANTYDATLAWIKFYYETGNLESKELAVELCAQLMQLTTELQEKVEKGAKDGQAAGNLSFYVSDVALENNFMILTSDSLNDCLLRLFSANGMIVNNHTYCIETEKWFNNLLDKSTLISGSSKKERHAFFQVLRNKIQLVIDKLNHRD